MTDLSQDTSTNCDVPEERLWSALDRGSDEFDEHLATCPVCRARAERLQGEMQAVANSAPAPPRPLPARVGPYRIRRFLGEGGMGIVYEGEQQHPQRAVAVKVIRGGQFVDEYRVRLFQREAQTLARLRHPGIADIYDAGFTADGQHYFAMEMVEGLPLTEYVRTHKLARPAVLDLFQRICEAINYAHQRGVIHRDLKPTNILIDNEGRPKILDFGLARLDDPDEAGSVTVTADGHIVGTLPYMSPEEARGSRAETDVRSDVYALGVILYQVVTGDLPYRVSRLSLPEAVRIICEEPPRRPTAQGRPVRGDLRTILLKTLEKDPARRYQTAAALGEDIRRFRADEPILARRDSVLYQLRKLIVRRRLWLTAAAVAILLVWAGRLWVDRVASEVAEATRMQEQIQDLAMARMARELGTALHDQGSLDRAIGYYRQALEIYRRLGWGETLDAGRTMLALGKALATREAPTTNDYYLAEERLLEAYDVLALQSPALQQEFLPQVLVALAELYGPDALDAPAALADIRELQSDWSAAIAASPAAAPRPPAEEPTAAEPPAKPAADPSEPST